MICNLRKIKIETNGSWSCAVASIDDHSGKNAADDVHVGVEIEEGDGGEIARRTARAPVRGVHPHLLDDARVGVLRLYVAERAVAGAVVGVVAARSDDPVPTERFEVDDERVAAAASLAASLLAGHRGARSPRPRARLLPYAHVEIWFMQLVLVVLWTDDGVVASLRVVDHNFQTVICARIFQPFPGDAPDVELDPGPSFVERQRKSLLRIDFRPSVRLDLVKKGERQRGRERWTLVPGASDVDSERCFDYLRVLNSRGKRELNDVL